MTKRYVLDGNGDVWLLVCDGAMATRAHDTGMETIGIVSLEIERGPLREFSAHELLTALAAQGIQ